MKVVLIEDVAVTVMLDVDEVAPSTQSMSETNLPLPSEGRTTFAADCV